MPQAKRKTTQSTTPGRSKVNKEATFPAAARRQAAVNRRLLERGWRAEEAVLEQMAITAEEADRRSDVVKRILQKLDILEEVMELQRLDAERAGRIRSLIGGRTVRRSASSK